MEGVTSKIAFLNYADTGSGIVSTYSITSEPLGGIAFSTLDYIGFSTNTPGLEIRSFPSNSEIWNHKFDDLSEVISMDIATDDKHVVLTDGEKVTIYEEDIFPSTISCDYT